MEQSLNTTFSAYNDEYGKSIKPNVTPINIDISWVECLDIDILDLLHLVLQPAMSYKMLTCDFVLSTIVDVDRVK